MLREIRKQLSIFVPLSQWQALRMECAESRISMSDMLKGWLTPHLERLTASAGSSNASASAAENGATEPNSAVDAADKLFEELRGLVSAVEARAAAAACGSKSDRKKASKAASRHAEAIHELCVGRVAGDAKLAIRGIFHDPA